MARGLKLTLCNVGRITDHGVQAVVRRISSLKILEVPTVFLYSTRAACRRLRAGHIGLAHRHAAAAPALAVLLVPFLSSPMQFRSAAAPATPPLAQPPRRRRRVRVPRQRRTSERAVRLRSLLEAESPPRPRVSSDPCGPQAEGSERVASLLECCAQLHTTILYYTIVLYIMLYNQLYNRKRAGGGVGGVGARRVAARDGQVQDAPPRRLRPRRPLTGP